MSANAERERPASSGDLPPLERNRYFYGKLMTPRDMRVEQAFHRARFDTLARFVTGSGIVDGLEVTEIRERRDRDGDDREVELEVTVQPGVAVDAEGRLLVVEQTVHQEFTAPDDDDTEVHVYLRYHETETERVPTPDLGQAVTDGCEFNRVVESPEVVCQYYTGDAGQGAYKPVPVLDDVDVPDTDEPLAPDDTTLGAFARSYRAATADQETPEARGVFLGAFAHLDGTWRSTGVDRRPLVYTNDMLYAALIRHVFDFGNPHRVTGGGGDATVPAELEERLGALEGAVSELQAQLKRDEERMELLEHYVVDRSLELAVQSFEAVQEEFESDAARDIVETVRKRIEEEPFLDPDAYLKLIGELLELENELQGEIRDEATEGSLKRYQRAVEHLDEVWNDERDEDEAERDLLNVVLAQDRVNETASWLMIKLAVYG